MRKNLDKLSGFDTRTQTTGMQMKTRTMTKLFAAAAAAGLALGLHAETALTFAPLAANRQTQDYVATDVTLPGDGDFTWEAWVKPSDVSLAENRLLGQTDWTSEGRLILELRKAGETDNVTKLAAFYRAGGANKRAVAGTTVFAADVWHHVALTRSGTALTLYVDGVQEGSASDFAGPLPAVPLTFAQGFAGTLSEVRVWTKALTAAEIASCRTRRLSGTVVDLAGAWTLGEGPGAPVNRTTGAAAKVVGFIDGVTPVEDATLDFSDGVPKPIALFRMSELKNGVVPDSSGNGRDLTVAAGCSLTNDAPEGTGLYFDGTMQAGAKFSHPALQDRTIAFWVKLTSEDGSAYDGQTKTTYPYIFGAFGATRLYYETGNDNKLHFGSGNDANKQETQFKVGSVNTTLRENWNFITMTYATEDTAEDNVKSVTMKVYVNGDPVATQGNYTSLDFGTKLVTNAFSAGTCILGNLNAAGTGSRPIKGVLDEVSVYDCALTPEQVLHLYAPRHTYETCRPVAGWDFDELKPSGSNRLVEDVTGSGVDLIVSPALVATNGVYGGGLYWDGLNTSCTYSSKTLPPMSDWSFSAWVNVSTDLPADTATYKLQRFYTFGRDSFVQTAANAANFGVTVYPHSTAGTSGWTVGSLPARNTWVHYVFSYRSHMRADASGYDIGLDWYENGVKGSAGELKASNANTLKTVVSRFLLGCNSQTDGKRNFCGAMDSVRVYRGALDEKAVRQLYLAPARAQAGADFTTARAVDVLRGRTDEKLTDTIANAFGGDATWSVVSAPDGAGTDLVVSPASLETSVKLPKPGTYVFRLTVATDSAATSNDVTVTRVAEAVDNVPPTCALAAAGSCTIPSTLALAATANDPDSKPGTLRVSWRRVSGPGPVEFSADAAVTTASFVTPGTYVLAATADDGQDVASAQTMVTVTEESGADLSAGLMHYWPLSAEAGQSVGKDVVGSRDLTLYNAASTWEAPGFTGYALRCNGENAQAYAAAQAFPSGLTKFTATCWLYEDTNESYYQTASVGRLFNYQGAFEVQHVKSATGSGYLVRMWYMEGSTLQTAVWKFSTPSKSVNGRWAHLTVLADIAARSSGARSAVRLYVDGDEMAMYQFQMPENTTVTTDPAWPGSRQINGRIDWGSTRGSHRVFPGLIDEMRIYSRQLSAAEIKRLASEMPTANRAPQTVVAAGDSAKTISRSSITLDPSVVDDGLPAGSLSGEWKVVSGDASKVSVDGNVLTFAKAGTYGLAYVATDGERTTVSPTVTVEVTPRGAVLLLR